MTSATNTECTYFHAILGLQVPSISTNALRTLTEMMFEGQSNGMHAMVTFPHKTHYNGNYIYPAASTYVVCEQFHVRVHLRSW